MNTLQLAQTRQRIFELLRSGEDPQELKRLQSELKEDASQRLGKLLK